jgi:DNA-binding transcriptional LysR family regulator
MRAMLEGVTIEQLRTLRAVAEAGSFSAAARKLGRVQAAVSQSIDRLEAQLGLRLFDRTGRLPRLTAHGEAVVAAAAKVGADVEALDELVAGLRQGAERTLSIVVDVLFPTESLVAFAKEFAREHPDVRLVLFTDVLSAVTAHVRERRSAWGIAIEDADLTDLDRRPIANVRLLPVAAPGHPLARRKGSLDGAALADAVQIVLGEHRHDGDGDGDGDGTTGDHGVLSSRTRTWRVVDLATKKALIAGGLGWGHMPEHTIRDELRARRLVQLRLDAWGAEPPRRSLVLVWRRHAVMGPVARWAQERLSGLCRRAVEPAAANHPE